MAADDNKGLVNTYPDKCVYEDDVLLPPHFLEGITAEDRIKDLHGLKYREGDVFVCTYPKCGTHWLGHLIYRLRKKPEEPTNFITNLAESVPTSVLDKLPSPRAIPIHLHSKRLPREHVENGGKIILCIRNPKDAAVSKFHHSKNAAAIQNKQTWDEFLAQFVAGQGTYKGFADYAINWEKFAEKNPDAVLTVYYEELKSDGLTNLRKIAKHLGVEKTDEELVQILEDCSIDNLRAEAEKPRPEAFTGPHRGGGAKTKDGKSVIYRKGEVGDWKNHFTVAQNEAYDKQLEKELANCSLKFIFEI